MTALQLYALFSPVIALVVMLVFAAILMKQTHRDIERLAQANVAREMQDTVAGRQVPVQRDKASGEERTFAQR
jgi:hypothetical protein